MITKNTTVTDDLRARQAACEGRQLELMSERDEISFAALVDRDKKAVARLSAINDELSAITNEMAGLQSALREAAKREFAAQEAQRAELRRTNAAKAADVLAQIEITAGAITTAMADLRTHSITLQAQFGEIRRLTGTGPTNETLRVNLGRSLKSATMGCPLQLEHLAPAERTNVADVVTGWVHSIRNWINAAIGDKPAKAA